MSEWKSYPRSKCCGASCVAYFSYFTCKKCYQPCDPIYATQRPKVSWFRRLLRRYRYKIIK